MENIIFERNEPFTEKTVLQIGIQILESFRVIHEAGYIYKDLKLDNVNEAGVLPLTPAEPPRLRTWR